MILSVFTIIFLLFIPLMVNANTVESTNTDSIKVTTLDEVVVKKHKNKYSKRNNPAFDLMTRIRAAKELNDPRLEDNYSYNYYDKLTLGIDANSMDAITRRHRFSFMKDLVDTTYISAFPVMLLSMREKAGTQIYSRSPRYSKDIITAQRNVGIDEAFNQENINIVLNDVLRNVDIYDNDITLMQNRFVSPLSHIAGDFYKYSLNDTVTAENGTKYVELVFTPHTPETFGFVGRMYVEVDDSTYFVRHVSMKVPRVINLNYIDNIYISQDFVRDSIGKRQKVREDISLEMNIVPGTPSLFGHRETTRCDFKYSPRPEFGEFIDRLGNTFIYPRANQTPWDEWQSIRSTPLTTQETALGSTLTQLRKIPAFYWGERILQVLVNGYIGTGKHSRVDLGPVNTLISYNHIEGLRFRVGGVTTAYLSPHWFGRAYVAYGCKDRKFKYDAELEYSFDAKRVHAREFPIHLLRARYKYELDMIGQRYLFTNQDNVFLSLKRKQSDLGLYKREGAIDYELELANNFSIKASVGHATFEATPWLPFITGNGYNASSYSLSELELTFRYAPGEKFVQARSFRTPVNLDAPVFTLTHRLAIKNFLNSSFTLNTTEASISKRFWFSAFGYIDAILKGGKIWSTVQYPELLWQNANLSYTIQPESYSLLNPMEFALDYYGSLDLTYWMNGLIFNRIPLLKKIKCREVIGYKMLMGGLTSKNNPALHPELFQFPSDACVGRMSAKPYMELSAGIDNIFTILRLDYVWRLTYRDTPGISKSGVRLSLHFTF